MGLRANRDFGGKVRSIFIISAAFISAISLGQTAPSPRSPRTQVMTLAEIEREAIANNPELRAADARVAVAKASTPVAGALDDPMFMYRNWGTPLEKPWDWNQAQHMLMYQQALPGPGKRAARTQVANRQVAESETQIEVVRRDIGVRIRKAY